MFLFSLWPCVLFEHLFHDPIEMRARLCLWRSVWIDLSLSNWLYVIVWSVPRPNPHQHPFLDEFLRNALYQTFTVSLHPFEPRPNHVTPASAHCFRNQLDLHWNEIHVFSTTNSVDPIYESVTPRCPYLIVYLFISVVPLPNSYRLLWRGHTWVFCLSFR